MTEPEDLLHTAICQAVALLNQTVNDEEQRQAHNILRVALDSYGKVEALAGVSTGTVDDDLNERLKDAVLNFVRVAEGHDWLLLDVRELRGIALEISELRAQHGDETVSNTSA